MNKEEFNGYSFGNKEMRSKMRYIVIEEGDLDLNGAYAFQSEGAVKEYLENSIGCSRKILAVFKVENLTELCYEYGLIKNEEE